MEEWLIIVWGFKNTSNLFMFQVDIQQTNKKVTDKLVKLEIYFLTCKLEKLVLRTICFFSRPTGSPRNAWNCRKEIIMRWREHKSDKQNKHRLYIYIFMLFVCFGGSFRARSLRALNSKYLQHLNFFSWQINYGREWKWTHTSVQFLSWIHLFGMYICPNVKICVCV